MLLSTITIRHVRIDRAAHTRSPTTVAHQISSSHSPAEHNGDGVVEHTLSHHNRVQIAIDIQIVEHRQNGDGVSGGDQRAEEECFLNDECYAAGAERQVAQAVQGISKNYVFFLLKTIFFS